MYRPIASGRARLPAPVRARTTASRPGGALPNGQSAKFNLNTRPGAMQILRYRPAAPARTSGARPQGHSGARQDGAADRARRR